MCAGEEADFEAAKPYLALLGKRFFFVGPAGAGATVKLISNLCAGLHNLVCAEAFMLGKAAGFDPETLLAVFDGTDARSYHMTDYFALRAASGDFAPGFSIRLQHKDHRLAGELGRALGVPLYLNSLAQEMYQSMIAAGAAGRDLCAAVNLLGRAAGVGEVVPERASA
jgi:3-hydroxyisobutyrate dehydrogenase-like beta-hydroxyacid dehydrogenase